MPVTRQVGFLLAAKESDWRKYIRWFKAKLKTPNVNITFLPPGGASGDPYQIKKAAEYLAESVEVIVTASTQAALACKQATQTNSTPFVFASVGDPVISGLAAQAGGNFTGCSNLQVELAGERVEAMLKHKFQAPFAVVGNYNAEPIKSAMDAALKALQAENMQAQLAPITPQDNIETFIDGLKGQGIKSLYVCSDMFITTNSTLLNKRAHPHLKTMYEFSEHVDDHGGDLSYGVSFQNLFETAAEYVDKILSGTKAGDLPIYIAPKSKLKRAAKKNRPSQKDRKAGKQRMAESRRRR